MSESDRGFGRRIGKAPERSNFAQACTLLSQFLKEKRNLVNGNPETKENSETILPSLSTKNYFPTNVEGQAGTSSSTQNGVAALKSADFFQRIVGFGAENSNKSDLRTKTTIQAVKNESSSQSQMTIFYSGRVLVFNDLPTDKADEIIALARKGSSNISGSVSNPVVIETIDLTKPSTQEPKTKSDMVIDINKSNDENDDNNDNDNCSNKSATKLSTNETLQQRPTEPANGSDLPIARRNSLHRFLEKRKDRVASKAPYQVPNRMAMAVPKPDEGSSEGGECSEKQLELKL